MGMRQFSTQNPVRWMALCTLWMLTLFLFGAKESTDLLPDLEGKDRAEYIVANFYRIYSQDLQEAVVLTSEAVDIAEEGGWQELEGFAHTYHGVANSLSGQYDLAIAAFVKAVAVFEEIESDTGKGRLYNEMAAFYSKQEEMDRAYSLLDSAAFYANRVGDREALATSMGHRSAFLGKEGRVEEAHQLILEVKDIREEMNDSVGLGYIYLDLAEYELKHGRLEEANALVQRSSDIRTAIGDLQGLAINTVIFGENYMNSGLYREAIPYFRSTIQQGEALNYLDLVRFAYEQLQQCHLQLEEYKEAYLALEQNRLFSDSIFSVEKAAAISEVETRYETEKQQAKILQLDQENQLQATINSRQLVVILCLGLVLALGVIVFYTWRIRERDKKRNLAQQQEIRLQEVELNAMQRSREAERKRLASDLHDGLGQQIVSLNLALHALREGEGSEVALKADHALSLIGEMLTEVRNITFNLMPQILAQKGLVPALRALAQRLNQSGSIRVEVHEYAVPPHLAPEIQISVFRIVQEWLANVLRYNVAQSIQVEITGHDEGLVLMVEDDGQGFDPQLLEQSTGNGWRNMQRRSRLIGGELVLDTVPGRPVNTLILKFPFDSPSS